jgi:hypothetical protein
MDFRDVLLDIIRYIPKIQEAVLAYCLIFDITPIIIKIRSLGSVVGIATGYGLDD